MRQTPPLPHLHRPEALRRPRVRIVGSGGAGRFGGRRVGRRPEPPVLAAAALALVLTAVTVPLTRRAVRALRSRRAVRTEQRLEEQRGLDPLTGLPNRAEALWWLNTRLQRAHARSHRLALMVVDLDDFTDCNEVYGREVGDHVLQVTAARMQAELRTGDMVCRSGNDTFMVIMDAIGPDHLVSKVGQRLVASIAEPISYHGEPVSITASLGFALSRDRDRNPDLLLDRADRALIQAKASSRSIVQF
jgi:diguanylate cyclase